MTTDSRHCLRHAARAASLRRLLSGAAALVLSLIAPAADASAAPNAPAWKFQVGGDLRLRDEYFANVFTFDEDAVRSEQNYQRYRARVFSSVTTDAYAFNARLTWESWNWSRDSFKAPFKKGWVTSEGIFDLLNVSLKKPLGLPMQVTAGRQELTLGDGWLVIEGTPLDGSRTLFFDAIRSTISLSPATTLDLIYIDQSATNVGRLGTFNHKNLLIAEHDERSGIAYLSHRFDPQLQVDAYFMQRDLTRVAANGDNATISAVGSRVVLTPDKHWQLKGDGTYQFGTRNGRDLSAWGFLGQTTWFAHDALNQQVRFVAEALSGDKPGTADDEQFDHMWGRFPRWSEISILAFVTETRIAQIGNLLRAGPGWSVTPKKGFDLSFDYNGLWALENNRSTASGVFSPAGNFRGHLGRAVLKVRLTPKWSATVLGELWVPGSYYGRTHQDTASFLRVELLRVF